VHTLTADNGKEFAYHESVSTALSASFYFATPYHSWERGLNEHTNGLVRGYFPKSTNFLEVTGEQVLEVENLLNNRPRKILGFEAPSERFAGSI
jgi:IS30 family transposase